MSAETLKFFEEKNTEEIIDWMLRNLSEDQIRMCLDQSGIPDTSVIKGKQPIAAAATDSVPIASITLPDGSQKQLQPGEGSSSDPPPTEVVNPPRSGKRRSVREKFVDKYRIMCNDTGYIIKDVSSTTGVEYYEFKEIEDGDIIISPGLTDGDVGWVKKTVPISKFKSFCTAEDREIFGFLKEENMETFLGAPTEVLEVSADYKESGLVSPIPITTPPVDTEDIPTPVATEDTFDITEPMLKALKIQQASSGFISENYPDLFSRGLTMYPVFVYGSDGDSVLCLNTVVVDGKLSFIKDVVNKRLLNSKFKNVVKSIQQNITDGLYTPSDNIQEELNEALKSVSPEITFKISKIYDPIKISGYTYFGTLDDDEPEWLKSAGEILPDSQESFDVVGSQEVDEDMLMVPQLEGDSSPRETFDMSDMSNVINTAPKNKKVSDMSIPEIEERMRIQFGERYVRDYKPEKYVNSLGVTNVRYVKRPNCPPTDEPVMVANPIFTEFQGKPSINTGPGRFGDADSEDEDLLFD
tara:strand:- start:620 stop:2194 length:1575 start_codon:yes stop_codon:yes gene_type:complete